MYGINTYSGLTQANNKSVAYRKSDHIPVVDDVVAYIVGDFGKWQLQLSIMMALLKLPIAWYQLNIIFLAPPTEFWCKKPKSFADYTNEKWREISVPLVEEHPCLIFDPELLHVDPKVDVNLIPLVKCHDFEYDMTVFNRTIISEWNLVCDKQWMVNFTQVITMSGVLIGNILFGVIGDKYGRKKPLIYAVMIQSLMSYVSCFMPTYWSFVVSSFILSLASGGVGILSFVLIMEVVSGQWRTTIPVLYQLPFGLANPVMAGLAYWLRDWRKLQFALSTLSASFILCWFFISESPRWLLAVGDTEKAYDVLKRAARINNRKFNRSLVKNMLKNTSGRQKSAGGYSILFKSRKLRPRTILLSLNWFITGLCFYVLAQYLGFIGDNIFLTVTLSGLISSVGPIVCVFIITKMGRRVTLMICVIVTGICFVSILVIPSNMFANDWPRLLLAGIGFAGMGGSVPALYLFSGEMYPTIIRNSGLSFVSTFARIGSMLAPMVCSLNSIFPDASLILMAIASFTQLLLLTPLPETMNRPLADTIEQMN